MRFLIVGDIHEPNFHEFSIHVRNVMERGIEFDAVIQVGDVGIGPGIFKPIKQSLYRLKLNKPIYYIDGNHENHEYIRSSANKFAKIGMYYKHRATITVVKDGNCKIGWLGGAFNVDMHQRVKNNISNYPLPEDIELMAQRIIDVGGIDLLVTHSNPCGIGIGIHGSPFIQKIGPIFLQAEGYDWPPLYDCGDEPLTNLWNMIKGYRPSTWVFGHHHIDYHNKVENTDFYCVGHCAGVGIRRMPTIYIYDSIEKKML